MAALAGPVFAGLSRVAGARGRIAFGDREYAIAEIVVDETIAATLLRGEFPAAAGAIPLAAAGEDGEVRLIRDFTGLTVGSRVLILVPLAPFHDGRDNFAAAAERVYRG